MPKAISQGKFPRLDNFAEPGIKRLERCYFVEETAAHNPHLAGIAELCVGAIERGGGSAIHRDVRQIIANA